MSQISIGQKFKELSSKIVEEVKKRSNKDSIFSLDSYEVYVPDLTKMQFKKGKVDYFLETVKKQKFNVDFEDKVPKFYNEFCAKCLEFRELVATLEETFQIKEKQAENIVKNYVYYFMFKTDGDPNDKDLDKIIDKYVKNLKLKTLYVKTKIFLDGIWLENEHLQINENLKIRRIKPSDFEAQSPDVLEKKIRPFGSFPYVILKYNIPITFEIKNLIQFQTELLKRIRLIIYAFLLFRFGSVFSRKCIMPIFQPSNPDIIFQAVSGFGYSSCRADFTTAQMIHLNPYLFIKTRHTYVLSQKDIVKLNKIIVILNKSDIKEILLPEPKKSNYLKIALNRYQNAFLNAENLESQISYAISCLEALYLVNPGELQRKLQQRISKILNIFRFNSLVINDIVKRAYRVRSNYSHGVVKNIDYKELEKLSHEILQCARISLVFFLQVDNALQDKQSFKYLNTKELGLIKERKLKKERKKYFLDILDNALIDDKSYRRLMKFIQKKSEIFLT